MAHEKYKNTFSFGILRGYLPLLLGQDGVEDLDPVLDIAALLVDVSHAQRAGRLLAAGAVEAQLLRGMQLAVVVGDDEVGRGLGHLAQAVHAVAARELDAAVRASALVAQELPAVPAVARRLVALVQAALAHHALLGPQPVAEQSQRQSAPVDRKLEGGGRRAQALHARDLLLGRGSPDAVVTEGVEAGQHEGLARARVEALSAPPALQDVLGHALHVPDALLHLVGVLHCKGGKL